MALNKFDFGPLPEGPWESRGRITGMGMMNVSHDPEIRIRRDAEYRIAQSRLEKARTEYHNAVHNLSVADIDQIMTEEDAP